MPTSSARVFIALTIPDVQRSRLGRLQGLVAPDLPGTNWVEPPLFHVTLAFLGDIPDVDLAPLCRAVADSTAGHRRFTLNLQGLGAFPDPTRPRVIWVGVAGPGLDALADLRADVVDAVAGAGYPPDDDRFSPHLTLGRLKSRRGAEVDMTPLVAHYRTWSAGNFEVAAVVTFASTLAPEGPTYMALANAPLPGPKRDH